MYSVTQRIANIKQPRGGYLPARMFQQTQLHDNEVLNEVENVSPNLVGLAVDYLTRFLTGTPLNSAFSISLSGATIIRQEVKARKLLSKITGLDAESIICACKLCGFDVCCRASVSSYKPIEEINPDSDTIYNIKVMVERSIKFFKKYGPVVKEGLTFQGGYTDIISTGDADFMTEDTLWDFKVSKSELKSKYTLQLLVYYVMGMHSIHNDYKKIKNLGLFNPRLNKVYILSIDKIESNLIVEVEKDVIGYTNKKAKKDNELNGSMFIEKEYFTAADVARMLNRSTGFVYKQIRMGYLPAKKVKNKYQIDKLDFLKYLENIKRKQMIAIIVTLVVLFFGLLVLGLTFLNAKNFLL